MKEILTVLIGVVLSFAESCAAGTINFDTDAYGNPISAPAIFFDTTALTTLYEPLGVTFSASGGSINGGAILNALKSNFGVTALSGTNFLAFNPEGTLSTG